MSEKKTIVKTGVVAELDGRYWSRQGADSQFDIFDLVQHAQVSDPQHCKHPEDMTYPNDPRRRLLARAKLVPITITTTYEVGENG